jgi:predicted signal transduction protein with EAL and GGDEF domain
VEDQATWDLLDGFGCDVVQGFYVSRPLEAESVTKWLHTSGYQLVAQPGKPPMIVKRVRFPTRESA